MLVPYIEGFGHPILKMAARSLAMYDAFIDRVTRDSGIGVGYQRTGSLQVEMAYEPPAALCIFVLLRYDLVREVPS